MVLVNRTALEEILSKSTPDKVVLLPLQTRKEKDQYIVGIPETSTFVAVVEMGYKAIGYFQSGLDFGEAEKRIQEEYGNVNLKKFVVSLGNLGFVASIDRYQIEIPASKNPSLAWIRPGYVSWLFSLPMYVMYVSVIASAGWVLIQRHSLFPSYHDFFWTKRTSMVILANFFISNASVALHELAHLFAARSRGVWGRFGVGTRLSMFVIKNDVSGVWVLPKSQRYRVYLAGMVCNVLISAISLLTLAYVPVSALVYSLLKVTVLLNFLALIPQFYLYVRMDMYFVLLNILDCYNLYNDARDYSRFILHKIFSRLRRKPFDQPSPLEHLRESEQKKIKLYMWFMIVGVTIAIYTLVLYRLPIRISTYIRGFNSTWIGVTQKDVTSLVDGLITLLSSGVLLGLFIYVYVRDHQRFFKTIFKKILTFSPW